MSLLKKMIKNTMYTIRKNTILFLKLIIVFVINGLLPHVSKLERRMENQ